MKNDTEKTIALEDAQLERALLVAIFTDIYATEAMRQLQGIVVADDFTSEEFAETWKVIASCYNKGKEISPLNIYSIGKEMGIDVDIKRYMSRESIFADAETLGRTLHALGQRRRLANEIEDIYFTLLYDTEKTNEQVIAQLDKITKDMTATSDTNVESFADVYGRLLKHTQDKANGLIPQGVPTGFALIDRKGGLERGELMIIAGRNSNGKTSLALCIALNAAKQGEPIGIFSLEMTNLQLTTRLASLLTGINGESIKRADLTQGEWERFVAVDGIYLVYRPERHGEDVRYPDMSQNWSQYPTKGTALLMCVKNRQGALNGEQMLAFDAATTRFYERDIVPSEGADSLPKMEDIFDE